MDGVQAKLGLNNSADGLCRQRGRGEVECEIDGEWRRDGGGRRHGREQGKRKIERTIRLPA